VTPGIDCDLTLTHAGVAAGAAVGFFLVREKGRGVWRTRRARAGRPLTTATGGTAYADFGQGAREWRLSVRFESNGVDYRQAAASAGTLAQLRAFYALAGAVLTLGGPAEESYPVRFLALEERTNPPEPGATAEVLLAEAL